MSKSKPFLCGPDTSANHYVSFTVVFWADKEDVVNAFRNKAQVRILFPLGYYFDPYLI